MFAPPAIVVPSPTAHPSSRATTATAANNNDFPIPKTINYVWLGQTFDQFNQVRILDCAKQNRGHTIQLWIDDFSMVDLEDEQRGMPCLSRILDSSTYNRYSYAIGKITKAEGTAKCIEMLVSAQQQYLAYVRNNPTIRGSNQTAVEFSTFIVRSQLDHDVDIKIRYLSADFYEPLLTAEAQNRLQRVIVNDEILKACGQENKGPEMRLLEWAFYERYRKNYAAASNLLRVQLLQTHPGIYIDHDDTIPVLGDLTGFKYARSADYSPTNAFLASAENHPFLQIFRDQILQRYTTLQADRNKFFDYAIPNRPTEADDLDHPFITYTNYLSGPDAFAEVVKNVRAGSLGPGFDITNAWLKTVRINPTAIKTWALQDS